MIENKELTEKKELELENNNHKFYMEIAKFSFYLLGVIFIVFIILPIIIKRF